MVLAVTIAGSVWAQDEATGVEEAPAQLTVRDRALGAIRLPASADAVRAAGVDAEQVAIAVGAMRDRGLRPADAATVLDVETAVTEAHGPINNFGAVVQQRLDEGLRGRDLATAIRAEHAVRNRVRPRDRGRWAEPGGTGNGLRPRPPRRSLDVRVPRDRGATEDDRPTQRPQRVDDQRVEPSRPSQARPRRGRPDEVGGGQGTGQSAPDRGQSGNRERSGR